MNLTRIYGLFLRHFYLITRSFPRILDLIYWPTIQIFLWGFISKFFTLNSSYYDNTVGIILSAAILYDFLFRSSISYNMMFLEEIWSRNFTNLFVAPLKVSEIIKTNSSLPADIRRNHVVFFEAEELDKRIASFEENCSCSLKPLAEFEPSYLDKFVHWLNPVNDNEKAFVYELIYTV